MASALEYVSAELLEISDRIARVQHKTKIIPRHIRNDHEFNELLKNVTIPSGGVVPQINPFLLLTTKERQAKQPPN